MSNIRRSHPGYFRVTVLVGLAWYVGLGVSFALRPTPIKSSSSYSLIVAYMPLRAWAVVYVVLGALTLSTVLWSAMPHVLVRGCYLFGMMLSVFWLNVFVYGIAVGKTAPTVSIPAFLTLACLEATGFIEPERPRARPPV